MNCREGCNRDDFCKNTCGLIHDATTQIGQRISKAIDAFLTPMVPEPFHCHQQKKNRNAEKNNAQGIVSFFVFCNVAPSSCLPNF